MTWSVPALESVSRTGRVLAMSVVWSTPDPGVTTLTRPHPDKRSQGTFQKRNTLHCWLRRNDTSRQPKTYIYIQNIPTNCECTLHLLRSLVIHSHPDSMMNDNNKSFNAVRHLIISLCIPQLHNYLMKYSFRISP